jgi:hypothetical protein
MATTSPSVLSSELCTRISSMDVSHSMPSHTEPSWSTGEGREEVRNEHTRHVTAGAVEKAVRRSSV